MSKSFNCMRFKILSNFDYVDYYADFDCDGNIIDWPGIGERYTLPSLTVPSQVLSLKEMLERYVRGENVDVFNPVYNGEDELPDIERMSEMDRIDAAREMKSELERTVEAMKRSRKMQEKFDALATVETENVMSDVVSGVVGSAKGNVE